MNKVFDAPVLTIQQQHSGEINTRLTADVRVLAEILPIIINDFIGMIFLSLLRFL